MTNDHGDHDGGFMIIIMIMLFLMNDDNTVCSIQYIYFKDDDHNDVSLVTVNLI